MSAPLCVGPRRAVLARCGILHPSCPPGAAVAVAAVAVGEAGAAGWAAKKSQKCHM